MKILVNPEKPFRLRFLLNPAYLAARLREIRSVHDLFSRFWNILRYIGFRFKNGYYTLRGLAIRLVNYGTGGYYALHKRILRAAWAIKQELEKAASAIRVPWTHSVKLLSIFKEFDWLKQRSLNLVRGRSRFLKDSKVFCMAPWMHLTIQPDGRVLPCCYGDVNLPIGNLQMQTLAEMWNSGAYKRIRLNMLAGKESPECVKCYELGRQGHSNWRLWLNSEYAHHFPLVETTREDGAVARLNLPYLNLRFSNLCNFRCRICSPDQSSKWHADGNLLGMVRGNQQRILTPTGNAEDLWRQIDPLLSNFEEIYFAGGEPLLMEQHYRFLNLLIAKKMFHVKLLYNTNFSIMRYKGRDIMPLWDKFKVVRISASLDALGRRGEYLRKGQDWKQVICNRERMFAACPRAEFEICFTLNAMNALHLPDFHREWVEKGYIKPDSLHINILFQPEEYSVQILPRHLKEQVAEKYQKHIANMPGLSEAKKADFRSAVGFLLAQDKTGLLGKFRERTGKLDKIRGECFADVFPELAELTAGQN